jgi:hypothetical protein
MLTQLLQEKGVPKGEIRKILRQVYPRSNMAW